MGFMKKPISEVATLINGRAYSANELLKSGKYRVLRVGNFFSTSDYYYSDLELEPNKYCEKGDLLYAWSATFGARIWEEERVIYHYHIWKVEYDNQLLDKEFLCFLLNEMTENLKHETHGSTMMHLTKEGMERKQIIIPPIGVQKSFVLFLHQADKSKFDGFKSQFIEMFGTPDNHPVEYAVKNLGDLSECYAGATPSTKVREYWDNGTIPWMSSGEVHMGHVTETESKITESGYKHASTKMVPVHSVVIALAGQGKTRGTVAITEIPLCTNQSLCAIVPSKDIHYEYLYHNLKGRYLELRGMAGDVNGRGGLNLKIVQSIRVIVPPLSEQMRFVGIAQQADKSKYLN